MKHYIFSQKYKIDLILKSFGDAEGTKYPCWPIINEFSSPKIF